MSDIPFSQPSPDFQCLPHPDGSFVQVSKIAKCKNPVVEPGSWYDWKHGGANPLSLPVEYCVRGFLLAPIQVGEPIYLLRTWRNGVEAVGHFCSTPICAILSDTWVETFNSIYEIIPVALDDK